MRWQGAGQIVTSDDYDSDICIKGGDWKEQVMFDTTRIKTLRNETLPYLKSLLNDIDGSLSPNLTYLSNKNGLVTIFPHVMLSKLYSHVSKLLTVLEDKPTKLISKKDVFSEPVKEQTIEFIDLKELEDLEDLT